MGQKPQEKPRQGLKFEGSEVFNWDGRFGSDETMLNFPYCAPTLTNLRITISHEGWVDSRDDLASGGPGAMMFYGHQDVLVSGVVHTADGWLATGSLCTSWSGHPRSVIFPAKKKHLRIFCEETTL